MPPRTRATRPPPPAAGRIPPWIVAFLLFVAVWLGARILHNITDALTGMTAGVPVASGTPAWPARKMGDAAPP